MRTVFIIVWLSFCTTFVSAQTEVKVMSYNIRLDVASDGENRWDVRKDKVAGLINYYEPGFAGLQEVQHHQLAYLRTQLPEYAYIGVGRDDGKEAGEYSCIFYHKAGFEVIKQSTFWLAPTPDSVCFGWDAACRRVCTYALFQSKKTKQLFWVFNTHFDHRGDTARYESAKLVTRKIKELNTQNYPVIFMGDLNCRPGSEPITHISAMLNNAREHSATTPYGPPDTWNAFKFHEQPNGCIDYIFTSKTKNIIVNKFATITDSYEMKYPSDHFPVMAQVEIK